MDSERTAEPHNQHHACGLATLQILLLQGILYLYYRLRGADDMQTDDTQADGYYAEDDLGADDLDLSFLDDDADEKDAKK